jgi:hypothetical protein
VQGKPEGCRGASTWHEPEGFIMARSPKPWWSEDRQSWYVTIRGERHKLGPDQAEAERQFHELMAKPVQAVIIPKTAPDCLLVAEVFDKYLD